MANQISIDILTNTTNLTSGVSKVNNQLGSLNKSATLLTGKFRGLLSTLGFSIGVGALTSWVKDAAAEEAEFKRIAANFGDDAEGIVSKISTLSQDFKVDDGAIASYFNILKGKVQVGNDDVLAGIVKSSLTASAKFGQPAETYVNAWIKVLKDGKIKAQDLGTLGAGLQDTAEGKRLKEQFNNLKTTAEQIAFIQRVVQADTKPGDLVGPWQELTFELDNLKEAIATELLPLLQDFLDLVFPKDAEGKRSLAWWVNDLAIAITALWTATKLVSLAKFIKEIYTSPQMVRFLAWFAETTAGATTLRGAIALLWSALNPLKKAIIIGAIIMAAFNLLPEEVQESIKKAFKEIGDFIVKEIKQMPLVKAFTDRFDDIKKAWKEKDWAELGRIVIVGMILGFNPIPPSLRTALSSLYEDIKAKWKEKDWKGLGKMAVEGLLNLVFDYTALKTQIKKLYDDFKRNWASQNWPQLGKDVVAGIIKGLTPDPIEKSVTGLVGFIKRIWNRETQTKSPSKVFAEKGRFLVEGLSDGITKSSGLAGKAISNLADIVNQPMTSPGFAFAGGTAGRGNTINVTINAGLGTDPYELGRAVDAALNKYKSVNGRR